jgi:hypothetical protein
MVFMKLLHSSYIITIKNKMVNNERKILAALKRSKLIEKVAEEKIDFWSLAKSIPNGVNTQGYLAGVDRIKRTKDSEISLKRYNVYTGERKARELKVYGYSYTDRFDGAVDCMDLIAWVNFDGNSLLVINQQQTEDVRSIINRRGEK